MSAERIWALLGHRTGDNNQVLRLAGELGLPFRAIELHYNALVHLPTGLGGASFASLESDSRDGLRPPWPDLVLGIGSRSVPASLAIREESGGKVKLVRLGNPRLHPRNFDLVITTSQYPVSDAPNVIRLPVGISTAPQIEPTDRESVWLDRFPRHRRLLLLGGETFMWRLDTESVAAAAVAISKKPGGSLITVASRRTGRDVTRAVEGLLSGQDMALVRGGFPRYAVMLQAADEIYVTAESVAMMSDAVATGRPVGLVLPRKTAPGKLFYGLEKLGAASVPVRDIQRFWRGVRERGLAGTVEHPVAGTLEMDPLKTAAAAMRRLLGS